MVPQVLLVMVLMVMALMVLLLHLMVLLVLSLVLVDGVPVTVTILADPGKANQPEVMGAQGCADGNRSFLLGKEVLKSNSKGRSASPFPLQFGKNVPGGGNAVEMTIPVLEKRKTVRVAKSSATEAKKKSNNQKEGPQFPQDVTGSNVAEQAVVSADESIPKVKRSRVQTNKEDTASAAAASSSQHAPSAGQTWTPAQGGAMSIGSLNDFKKKKAFVRVSVPVPIPVPVPVPISVSVPQVPVSVPVPQVADDRMEVDDDLTSPQFAFVPLPVKMNVDKDLRIPRAGSKRKARDDAAVLAPRGARKAKRAKVMLAPRERNIQLALTATGYFWGPTYT
ncbi:hypothetical protein BSKO_04987 [Bryopsis sp. KO-2023]|nr:hypothetical protein BSKO_04987 [Bryopsis sp. KO-2023]